MGELLPLINQASSSGNLVVDTVAWLTLNAIKSERLQNIQLCQQNVTTAWRKRAMSTMQQLLHSSRDQADVRLQAGCFKESLERSVRDTVEPSDSALEKLKGRLAEVRAVLQLTDGELEEINACLAAFSDAVGFVSGPAAESDLPADRAHLDGQLQREVWVDDDAEFSDALKAAASHAHEEKQAEAEAGMEDAEDDAATAALAGFDSTLVQTREKESEQERHKETESEVAVDGAGVDDVPVTEAWHINELGRLGGSRLLLSAASLKLAVDGCTLPFHPSLFVSRNHSLSPALPKPDMLKDVMLLCAVNVGEGDAKQNCAVVVTLTEAESLRRAAHVGLPFANSDGLSVWKLGSAAALDGLGSDFNAAPQHAALLCSKFINGELWYSPEEISVMIDTLGGSSVAEREAYFAGSLLRRPRTLSAWRGTSVDQVRDDFLVLALRNCWIPSLFWGCRSSRAKALKSTVVSWMSTGCWQNSLQLVFPPFQLLSKLMTLIRWVCVPCVLG